jgi:hypothetical protein
MNEEHLRELLADVERVCADAASEVIETTEVEVGHSFTERQVVILDALIEPVRRQLYSLSERARDARLDLDYRQRSRV